MEEHSKKRHKKHGKKEGGFSGQIGFVMAAAGSAVGVGNLWRFPYLAAQDGGGLFILIYLILAAIWTGSSIVNFSQGYRPLAALYLCLGIVFIVLAVINYMKYRNEE